MVQNPGSPDGSESHPNLGIHGAIKVGDLLDGGRNPAETPVEVGTVVEIPLFTSPRDPGSPNLRMGAWNLTTTCVSEVIIHPLLIL